MKRILFCAGILALAASCTESEYDSLSVQNNQAKGITFQAVEGNEATTRGGFIEEEGAFVPFWYAEKDKIDVWGTNVGTTATSEFGSNFVTANKATYKATQSAKLGVFTGVSDNDVLDFTAGSTEETPSKFFALYPSGLTVSYATNVFTVGMSSVNLAAQTQKDLMGNGIYDNVVKYSATSAYPVNSYDAVGEKINLNFQRVLSGMVFSTANVDKYTAGANSIFGKLTKITLTAQGKKVDGTDAGSKSSLALANGAKLTVNVEKIAEPKEDLTVGDGAKEIVLTVGESGGLDWNDAANAFMVIAPVTRTADEYLIANYEFDHITLSDTIKTAKSWEAGKFYSYKTLDINNFNYLVTNGDGSQSNRALIINKGRLSDLLTADGKVKWGGNEIETTKFSDIVCNVELAEAELKSLAKFTALKNITLAKNTAIPAEAFKNVVTIESIDMPLVTSIDKAAFTSLDALKSLKLGSYQFENEDVNSKLFTSTNKANIVTLDISGVEDMTPTFGIERQLDFSGFTSLEEVTVKNGVKLSANAFNGCSALETVNGSVKLAVSAFEDCSSLTTINIEGTEIPEKAFLSCSALESVLVSGKALVPTAVSASAFENATKIQYMDLSQVTTLGVSAFKKAGLISASKDNAILTVGATYIPASAFEGTGVKMVEFANATSFATDILKDCSSLIQVKFAKNFAIAANDKPAANGWNSTFGTATNVNLFVVPGQEYVSDNNLTLPVKSGTATAITFKGIYAK